jgi:hypothetical protein
MKVKFTAYQTLAVHRVINVPDGADTRDIENAIADSVYNLRSWEWDESVQESSKNQQFEWDWEILSADSIKEKED